MMKGISVESPCPVQLNRMSKKGCNFYCGSCQSEVIDFRGKSDAYLKSQLKPGVCGIFDEEQLEIPVKMKPYRRLLFNGLAVLSFIGFSVKPLTAQTPDTVKTVQTQKASAEIDKENREKKERICPKGMHDVKRFRRRYLLRRKNVRGRFISSDSGHW